MKKTTILIALMGIFFSQPSFSGQLDNFEETATKKTGSGSSNSKSSSDDDSDFLGDCLGSMLEDAFIGIATGISHLGGISMARAGSDTSRNREDKIIIREKGEALLSNIRFDYSYQNVQDDIYANDYRLEIGYGAFGLEARQTDFFEKSPKDELGLTYIHGLLRLSAGNYVEIAPGVGTIEMDGNKNNNGFSFTLPVLIHPSKRFGFECRPTWSKINGNSIRDIDFAVLYGIDHASLKIGYRALRTGGEDLKGPYSGISMRY